MQQPTVGMEACKFVRTGMGKIAYRKLSEILKGATFQNPCQKISVMKSHFNKIVVVDSTPVVLLKRSFHQGSFPLDTTEL